MLNKAACLVGLSTLLVLSATALQAEIKIGIAGPLSGSALAAGEQQEIGANSAIAYLNANGGLLGEEIVTTSVDDACDPEQAKAAARKLVTEGVILVVGHVCSGASLAASKIYEDAGIVMISPASTNPKVTENGHGNVFRVIGRDDQQGIIAGNFLADNTQTRGSLSSMTGSVWPGSGGIYKAPTERAWRYRGLVRGIYAGPVRL
jgi:branched-chain amino acid transport system substrate-binding protein